MKVRLVKGPFGGQTVEWNGNGDIVMNKTKKMTGAQRYSFMYENSPMFRPFPRVEARYTPAVRPHVSGKLLINIVCMHPDGSPFFEYVEGSKRELK